jgi:hypothetical protein
MRFYLALIVVVVTAFAQQTAKAPESTGAARSPTSNETVIYDGSTPPLPNEGKRQPDRDSQIQSQIKDFTGLLVAVGFLQCVVLAVQLGLVRRQDEHFRNSERAWIMVELEPHEKGLLLQEGTRKVRDSDEQEEYTTARVKLTCGNEGRSPAWIENIYGRMDIVAEVLPEDDPQSRHLNSFGTLAPVGPKGQKFTTLDLRCDGHRKAEELLSVYVVVKYRDIFGIKRMTTAGYSIDRNFRFSSQQPDTVHPFRGSTA